MPCVNYANDKVYPEDEKNGWVRLGQDTGPPNIQKMKRMVGLGLVKILVPQIFIDLRDLVTTT